MKHPKDELFEKLAAIEHDRWADWQRYCHSKMSLNENGALLPKDCFMRWERQISTPYAQLSEAEKESDRNQVKRYWELIVTSQREAYERAIKNYSVPPYSKRY